MNKRSDARRGGTTVGVIAVCMVVLLAITVGAIAVYYVDWSGSRGSGAFTYDLDPYKEIDPSLIHYDQTSQIPVEMDRPRAIAVGPEDRIYVAGDRQVSVFSADGTKEKEIPIDGSPQCLTVAGSRHAHPGRVYVGMKTYVTVLDAAGEVTATWDDLGPKAELTSIAAGAEDVFVADAGSRVVHRYDTFGKLLGRIGERDVKRNVPGFVIPSPYFDVAVAPDGLLRVANPGEHRIEAYFANGDLEIAWGKPSLAIEGFCGCCNPANFAMLPDGRFVTAEKGIARVKVYSPRGEFESVVVGPKTLAPAATATEETRDPFRIEPVDVAADSRGRVLVLDPTAKIVRVFEDRREARSE